MAAQNGTLNGEREKAGSMTNPSMIITSGRTLSWDEWVQAVEHLEAKAELADHNGLHHTAQSWRDMIASLHLQIEEQ
jgi:hypothetical protein